MTNNHHHRERRSGWWYFGAILAGLALLTFLLARCDIRHLKWKTTPEIVVPSPIDKFSPYPHPPTGTVTPAPSQLPHHDELTPIPSEGIVEANPDATVDKDGVIVDDGNIDSRNTDPHELELDEDLIKGDTGVEKKLGIQPLAALKKLYPDKAISGTYPVNTVIAYGSRYFGAPYQYGSDRATDKSFDCSDFTRWIWLKAAGMDIPKDSRAQWKYVDAFGSRKFTDLKLAQRGDLLFFMSYKGWQKDNYTGVNKAAQTITHVGIYLGNGKMMHTASAATGGVRIDNIYGKHLEWRFIKGGSVI